MSSYDLPQPAVSRFSVVAPPDPGVMPRVLELFAKRGLVPDRWVSQVAAGPPPRLEIDIRASGLDARTSAYLARCMGQIALVECVLTSERTPTAAAGKPVAAA